MQSILARLRQQEYIKLVIFSDHTILNEPVEKWPFCNCLVAFYSKVANTDEVLLNNLQFADDNNSS